MKLQFTHSILVFAICCFVGCTTPMYYSDKLSTPIITDTINTVIECNSGVELFQRSKWILKGEVTQAVIKNIFITANTKLVKGFTRDPIFGSMGASAGFYFGFSKGHTYEAGEAQIQVIAGYDQGRNIGTFQNPPVIGGRENDVTFTIDMDKDLLISVFAIRRYVQFNYVLNLGGEVQMILSYRHSSVSNSRFSLLNDHYIYDEKIIYNNGSSSALYEPALTFLTGKDVVFSIQIGKIFGAEKQSFAVSPVFLAFGTQYGF